MAGDNNKDKDKNKGADLADQAAALSQWQQPRPTWAEHEEYKKDVLWCWTYNLARARGYDSKWTAKTFETYHRDNETRLIRQGRYMLAYGTDRRGRPIPLLPPYIPHVPLRASRASTGQEEEATPKPGKMEEEKVEKKVDAATSTPVEEEEEKMKKPVPQSETGGKAGSPKPQSQTGGKAGKIDAASFWASMAGIVKD